MSSERWTPVVVNNVTILGPQNAPNVTNVSRDGGHSVLLSNRVTWLYDDTQCMSQTGKIISFISNTAAISSKRASDSTTVEDYGIVEIGKDALGSRLNAILEETVVGYGGWIPFSENEIKFNTAKNGRERIAIWPGTAPTPINTTHAFLYAPLVYVNDQPDTAAVRFVARGMTLVLISSPEHGPQASRLTELIFPDEEIQFGGFAAVLGSRSLELSHPKIKGDRDVYLFGVASAGLQVARVALSRIRDHEAYRYFSPRNLSFSRIFPDTSITDPKDLYLGGTFSSGNVFYSPYFETWIMVYFNKYVDSTFYIRYLDLEQPKNASSVCWEIGGKFGQGITSNDVEALVQYAWSEQQVLYKSEPGPGGYNYAGAVHPEYFNRHYYPDSSHYNPEIGVATTRQNDWHGGDDLEEQGAGGDGKHVMLSWTMQERGGADTGLYKIMMARLEFGDIPATPSSSPTGALTAPRSTGDGPMQTERAHTGGSRRRAPLDRYLVVDRAGQGGVWMAIFELIVVMGIMVSIVMGVFSVF